MITSVQQQRFYNPYTHRLVTTPPPPQPTAGEFYNSCQYRWPSANLIIAIIRCQPYDPNTEPFPCLYQPATSAYLIRSVLVLSQKVNQSARQLADILKRQLVHTSPSPPHPHHA